MPVTNPRFDLAAPVPAWESLGAVHLVAIGGAGMSAVARLLLARGVVVSGSDAADSPALEALRAAGARVAVGHDPAHLAGVDTVVVSSAVREDNPELAAARSAGLRVLHRSQALAALLGRSRAVAVAGTNGKTTTTAMLVVALAEAGADPSFACGGEVAQLGTNAALGTGDAFVVEADESDGSFVVYRPAVGVVTTVQPDHLDFYGTPQAVTAAFGDFAATVADLLVVSADDPGAAALARSERARGRRVLTFGASAGADLRLLATTAEGLGTRTTVVHHGSRVELVLAVPGAHNVANASAALLAAVDGLGAERGAVLRGLAGFTGARRRFEVRGVVGDVTVVDDYAHNPAKVAAVVSTAAGVLERAGRGRLLVVFQPHLYSRTRDFAEQFAAALEPADHVVLLDVYGAREAPEPGVTSALVADPLVRAPGQRRVEVGVSRERAVSLVTEEAAPGDLVLTVGAGDVTALGPLLLQRLAAREAGG
ncbi:UDP-N-acetylmuramate--L-alanine ligase [Phycicoccus endophyticus]|uniref:UDP-N-acetylmuramate--L-alanine ligase n=1 Tax=Phycicoccus endophyticus TaxID=1690220 RepID=A0A7G9R544_9MICO|nr:UDP-N-acetylmuramate--L-alanine ligase [Phycicoccus endophyticus]NHI20908.1 UDP-N-acetylmuramate--L-alanine ligase [Phycicoccus endophyticus]QNN50719.1 UDP-N-acetylmuramate--L-alanine ligase [Phycicoccus endophyticus]GGL22021.1 UDP-N-acetylmuramate--L-alanine ligase [Phycicoccus endophyticus]